jgi:hypothetical protein
MGSLNLDQRPSRFVLLAFSGWHWRRDSASRSQIRRRGSCCAKNRFHPAPRNSSGDARPQRRYFLGCLGSARHAVDALARHLLVEHCSALGFRQPATFNQGSRQFLNHRPVLLKRFDVQSLNRAVESYHV